MRPVRPGHEPPPPSPVSPRGPHSPAVRPLGHEPRGGDAHEAPEGGEEDERQREAVRRHGRSAPTDRRPPHRMPLCPLPRATANPRAERTALARPPPPIGRNAGPPPGGAKGSPPSPPLTAPPRRRCSAPPPPPPRPLPPGLPASLTSLRKGGTQPDTSRSVKTPLCYKVHTDTRRLLPAQSLAGPTFPPYAAVGGRGGRISAASGPSAAAPPGGLCLRQVT